MISNWFADFFLPNFGDLQAKTPPREKVVIFGNGNPKGNRSNYQKGLAHNSMINSIRLDLNELITRLFN